MFQTVWCCVACFKPFKFVLFRVVAVLGCAWLSWLFYVAFCVIVKLDCFKMFQIASVVLFFRSLQFFNALLKTC